jgi:hypothetical protein
MSKDRYLSVTFHAAIEIEFTIRRGLRPAPQPLTSKELVTLKPAIWGISIDLKEVWRRFRKKWLWSRATRKRWT